MNLTIAPESLRKGNISKTLVIGLDAATWRAMRPLIEQGKLPNIQMLIEEGASGILRSTIPPMTPLAWTSIATGVNPGKHGIYDFVAQDRKTYRVFHVNWSYLTRPAIWDIFSAYGKKIGVVNFPLAFPPSKSASFFVSGFGSPENESYAYPPELNLYLKSKGYRIYPRFRPKNGARRYFNEVKDLTKIQCEVTIELIKQRNWELFWVIFQGLDWIQHYLWKATVNGENAVAAFYCYMDCVIGRLIQQADNDWNIVVLSDHGFHEIKAEIHLNNLLEEWGYLKRSEMPKGIAEKIRNSTLNTGWKLSQRLPFAIKQQLKRHIPETIHADLGELRSQQLRLHELIDWNQTRAFSFGYMGRIYIHEKGKYPKGTVTSGSEYEELREEIIAKLRFLKAPESRGPIVGKIFRKEEIYTGDQLEGAPDIIFNPYDFVYMICGDFGNTLFHRPQGRIADHDMEGIIIIKGKIVRQGVVINADAVDITPTLLYLHNLPVLEDMDGQVLQEGITKKLMGRKKVKTVKDLSPRKNITFPVSEEDQQELEKRLKDLGYL